MLVRLIRRANIGDGTFQLTAGVTQEKENGPFAKFLQTPEYRSKRISLATLTAASVTKKKKKRHFDRRNSLLQPAHAAVINKSG